ncbi:O-antigen ligase family protein [Flavobacterium sp. U410]
MEKEELNSGNSNQSTVFKKVLENLIKDKLLLFVLYGMILSYFYNLPVLKYSIKGDNEFRLYDIFGVFILYYYYKNHKLINYITNKVTYLKVLKKFIYWCMMTMVISLFFYIYNSALLSFLQVILYLYHFIVFYLSAVFFYIFCLDKKVQKNGVYLIIILSILCSLIVLLQNLGIVNFLWSDAYKDAYGIFLSGTLGPNKIVLGMTTFFSFAMCMGVFLERQIKINRILLYSAILLNLYILILSGSRTSYVALGVFVLYFALRSPRRFTVVAGVFSVIFFTIITINPDLRLSMEETLENRIYSKLRRDQKEDKDVGDYYSDLGSGRDKLTITNAIYIIENPLIIPFGAGFMNRFDKAPGLSAHNMYLQVIKETGLVGFVLYFGWLFSYFRIKFDRYKDFSLALNGMVWAMLVTLFFGEHLYIYRPLFGLLGLFLMITSIFVSGLHKIEIKKA